MNKCYSYAKRFTGRFGFTYEMNNEDIAHNAVNHLLTLAKKQVDNEDDPEAYIKWLRADQDFITKCLFNNIKNLFLNEGSKYKNHRELDKQYHALNYTEDDFGLGIESLEMLIDVKNAVLSERRMIGGLLNGTPKTDIRAGFTRLDYERALEDAIKEVTNVH